MKEVRSRTLWSEEEWDLVAAKVMELREAHPDSMLHTLVNIAQSAVLPVDRIRESAYFRDRRRMRPLYQRIGLDEYGQVPAPAPVPVASPPPPVEPVKFVTVPSNLGMAPTGHRELTREEVSAWLREHATAGFLLDEVGGGFTKILDEIRAGRNELATVRQAFVVHVKDMNVESGKLRQECLDLIEQQNAVVRKAIADTTAAEEMMFTEITHWENAVMTVSKEFHRIMDGLSANLIGVPGASHTGKWIGEVKDLTLLVDVPTRFSVAAAETLNRLKTNYPDVLSTKYHVVAVGPRDRDEKHIQDKLKDYNIMVHSVRSDDTLKIPKEAQAVFVLMQFAHHRLNEVKSRFHGTIVQVDGGVTSLVHAILGTWSDVHCNPTRKHNGKK